MVLLAVAGLLLATLAVFLIVATNRLSTEPGADPAFADLWAPVNRFGYVIVVSGLLAFGTQMYGVATDMRPIVAAGVFMIWLLGPMFYTPFAMRAALRIVQHHATNT